MTVPVEDELSVVLSNSIISTDYSPISPHSYSLLYIFVTSSRYVEARQRFVNLISSDSQPDDGF